MELETITLVK